MADNVWDDQVDDNFLLQASQMVEKNYSMQANAHTIDPEELAEMTRILDQDDDWIMENSGDRKRPNRFEQTRTVFHESPPVVKKRSNNANKFQSSFDDVKMKPPPMKGLPKHTFPIIATTSKEEVEMARLKAELEKAKKETKDLKEDQVKKQGEISILRTQMNKKDTLLVKERQDRQRQLAMKDSQLKQVENQMISEVKAAKSEKEFLEEDLRKLRESLKKMNGGTAKTASPLLKRNIPAESPAAPRAKRAKKLPAGIDESFLDEENETPVASKAKIARVEKEVQTNEPEVKHRKNRTKLRNPSNVSVKILSKALISENKRVEKYENDVLTTVIKCIGKETTEEHAFSRALSISVENEIKRVKHLIDDKKIADKELSFFESSANLSQYLPGRWDYANDSILDFGIGNSQALLSQNKLKSSYLICLSNLFEKFDISDVLSGKEKVLKLLTSLLKNPAHLSNQNVCDILKILRNCTNFTEKGDFFLDQLCRGLKDLNCFVTLLCHAVLSVLRPNESGQNLELDICQLAESFVRWFSVSFVKSFRKQKVLLWIGISETESSTCRCCREELLKALTATTYTLIKDVLCNKREDTRRQSLIRACLLSLYHLWNSDRSFVNALSNDVHLQRQYIWLTQQFSRIKPLLNLNSVEETILGNLTVLGAGSLFSND